MTFRDQRENTPLVPPARYVVSEIEGRDLDALQSIATHIGRSARRVGVERVEFRLPHDHAFGHLGSTLGCEWEIEHPRNHGIMARITNLSSLLRSLAGELSRRVAKAALPRSDYSIVFATDIGTGALAIDGGKVKAVDQPPPGALIISLTQMSLTQLVMGYRSVDEMLGTSELNASRKAIPLLRALFPKSIGYLWWSDRF